MNEKEDCKIVQDLLPNYIEKLTKDQTNNFVEEHLKKCSKCKQIFENMQKDLNFNNPEIDGREVKYIKKFSKRIKLLKNILIVIVVLFLIIVVRKTIILTSLSNKMESIKDKNNYYVNLQKYSKGNINIIEIYQKNEENFLTTEISYINDKNIVSKSTFYKCGDEQIHLIDIGENKKLIKETDNTELTPISFISDNFFINIYFALTRNIDKITLDGKECYMIRYENTEEFIDANTGLPIKKIDNDTNTTIDIQIEYDKVEDTDIVKPDLTGYTEFNI